MTCGTRGHLPLGPSLSSVMTGAAKCMFRQRLTQLVAYATCRFLRFSKNRHSQPARTVVSGGNMYPILGRCIVNGCWIADNDVLIVVHPASWRSCSELMNFSRHFTNESQLLRLRFLTQCWWLFSILFLIWLKWKHENTLRRLSNDYINEELMSHHRLYHVSDLSPS